MPHLARLRAAHAAAPQPLRSMRRPRLLVIGCGDVGQRAVQALGGRWTVRALTSQPERANTLRALGITPLIGNLDTPDTLRRLGALAPRVLHLAPPPSTGQDDPRTRHLLQALARHTTCKRLVYGSTTGVYGDTGGARFDETRPVAPVNVRARRRVAAESAIRNWSIGSGTTASILRIPGIYAGNRPGGHPRERLARGTPVLHPEDDVYTNHIHADDLARLCIAALLRGRPQRIWHACDDTELKMGDYFDLAARLCGLPLPRRISREEARAQLSPMLMSFMGESRRLDNRRMKQESRLVLRYPDVHTGLLA